MNLPLIMIFIVRYLYINSPYDVLVLGQLWNGYVLVTDNLDRNVRPRHQMLTSQTVSMHWSNAIAVKD